MPGWHFASVVVSSYLFLSIPVLAQPTTQLIVRPAGPEKGWTIAEAHTREAYPIVLGRVGAEIDPVERQQYQLFDGAPDYSSALYPFQTPIPGFIVAELYESKSGKPFIAVTQAVGGQQRKRLIPLKPVNLTALQNHLGAQSVAIQVSTELVRVSATRSLHTLSKRRRARIQTSNAAYSGHLLPVIENGTIFMALNDGSTRSIRPEDVEQLTIRRSIVGQIMASTAGKGIQGALTGATAGLFAGLTFSGHSALGEMRFGAITGGIVGLGLGFLDGIFSAEGSKTYTFRPKVEPDATELYLTMAF